MNLVELIDTSPELSALADAFDVDGLVDRIKKDFRPRIMAALLARANRKQFEANDAAISAGQITTREALAEAAAGK